MVIMIICEVGLNHCGDIKYADEYVGELLKAKPDGLTFQIREKEFYKKEPGRNLLLPDKYYETVIPRVKSSGIKFGMAICDPDKVEFCEKIGADFYKIIRDDIKNYGLISKLLNTGKKVFVSTGMASLEDISAFIGMAAEHRDQVTLIHTQLSHLLTETNLRAITVLRDKFNLPVAFGSHAANHNILYMALGFEPSDVFFYVKGDRAIGHLDNEHAIELRRCKEAIDNLRELSRAIGDGRKVKMGIEIKGMI